MTSYTCVYAYIQCIIAGNLDDFSDGAGTPMKVVFERCLGLSRSCGI